MKASALETEVWEHQHYKCNLITKNMAEGNPSLTSLNSGNQQGKSFSLSFPLEES